MLRVLWPNWKFPVLFESPSSLLPVTDDSQLNLILVHCGNPPIVRLEYMEMFARLSKISFSGSDGGNVVMTSWMIPTQRI